MGHASTVGIVVDTNVLVSRAMWPQSVPARAVAKAVLASNLLFSEATWVELAEVLFRRKFDPYLNQAQRNLFLEELRLISTFLTISTPIHACRDPRDDKFLEVAVHGRADLIVTGDSDLLALHPFQGIAILTPAGYLEQGGGPGGIL